MKGEYQCNNNVPYWGKQLEEFKKNYSVPRILGTIQSSACGERREGTSISRSVGNLAVLIFSQNTILLCQVRRDGFNQAGSGSVMGAIKTDTFRGGTMEVHQLRWSCTSIATLPMFSPGGFAYRGR